MVALRKPERKPDLHDARYELRAGVRGPHRDEIAAHHLIDETRLVGGLIERAVFSDEERRRTGEIARRLAQNARDSQTKHQGVDAFMHEYGLSSEEGIILMCLAETLLRIPDSETADRFLAEKLAGGQWERHLGHSDSMFVNASTWGLMLTGRVMRRAEQQANNPWESLKRLVARSGEAMIRQAVRQAVRLLGDHFVLGRGIREALERAEPYEARGFRFSYDMLGEAARTAKDADRYFERYMSAIDAVGVAAGPMSTVDPDAIFHRPSVSVKLSALHPRFEPGRDSDTERALLPRVIELVRAAAARNVPVTIDAEEQDRLEPTLDIFAGVFLDPAFAHWSGLSIAVQAYSRRAIPVLRWLRRLAEQGRKRIPVRLVKGAYWDSEIKLAQERGLNDYPVLTRKLYTDVSYLAAMRLLLSDQDAFYPQFATHNAHTIASALVASGQANFEFQRLYGMGEALYEDVAAHQKSGHACRIYAPVGDHEDLLSYLVRRLLENGANTSFVNRLADADASLSEIVSDPVEVAEREHRDGVPPKLLIRPREIFWPERKNSQGLALSAADVRLELHRGLAEALARPFEVGPIVSGQPVVGGPSAQMCLCPHDSRDRIGSVRMATPEHLEAALEAASKSQHGWDRWGGQARAKVLDYAADLVERERTLLMAVLVREAGKTIPSALAEVRETVDLLRYYAGEARRVMVGPQGLKSPTGETNTIEWRGRGVFAVIAPWNFPLAIFVGQVAAALAAGNTVVAKPAEQTPIMAFIATHILHDAGVPKDVLHLVTGGGTLGAALVRSPRVRGIAFTGSTETAYSIHGEVAARRSGFIPFIAETGGINAMIADSSALPEQVVRDAIRSAFDSAGQRCSAARVLFVQDDVAGRMLRMLTGAIEALTVGDPMEFSTDVGPVIDEDAQDALDAHKVRMQREARELIDMPLPEACRAGTYVTPACYEIESLAKLEREVFGPILHVVRFGRGQLPKVIEAINTAGYGLTIGLHSRINAVADYVAEHARVGNLYVNRNQIGAVPGIQPFGGEGLSGTGPKAGGPNYLTRFAVERVRTTDITATGGNVGLLKGDG